MKRKTKLLIAIGIFVAADIVIGALLVLLFKYDDTWYPKTTINGVDVSGMSYEESIDAISGEMKNYSLTVNGRDGASLVINASDIGLGLGNANEIVEVYNRDHDAFLFNKLFKSDDYEVELGVDIDEGKLSDIVNASQMVTGSDEYELKQPLDAKVEYSESEKRVVIVPETKGNIVDSDKLSEYIYDAVSNLETQIDIANEQKYPDAYKKPEITSESESVISAYQNYNSCLYQWVTWDMGEEHYETITPDDIRGWIMLKTDGTVSLDKEKMSDWIEEFCLKYKTVDKTREFTTHDGRKIQVAGGDYGWRMDYEKTVEAAYEELTSEKQWSDVESYIINPVAANQANLTVTLEPIFSNTAFKMDYTNPTNDWDKNNYSEVDISEQKVYVYKDGELAHEAICVTGLPSNPERKTKTGCFFVKEKKESYILRGADYTTPTKFWIRITWSGTGYHYMNRRDWGSWTKDTYKSKGSHGCVNLQYNDASTLFGLINFYDAVFIHE